MKSFFFTLLILSSIILNAQDFNQISTNDFLDDMLIEDFNGDGNQDVFGINYQWGDPSDSYFLFGSDALPISFDSEVFKEDHDIKGRPGLADYEGDGDWDIFISVGDNFDLFLLENDGMGNFTETNLGVSGISNLGVADLNGNGQIDIYGYNGDTNKFDIFINDGIGSFFQVNLIPGGGSDIVDFDAGDLDNDGDLDFSVVFDERRETAFAVYKNQSGVFSEDILETDEWNHTTLVELADANNDGLLDLITAAGGALFIWHNTGGFNFEKNRIGTAPGSPIGFRELTIADLTGNGVPEIVGATHDSGIYWYRKSFSSDLHYTQQEVGGVTPALNFGQGDFDNDGDIDLFASNGDLWIYENLISQIPVSSKDVFAKNVEVFPNPTTNEIRFNNLIQDDLQGEIFDLNGKLISTFPVNSDALDCSYLNEGVYFLKLKNEDNSILFSTKFVKIN